MTHIAMAADLAMNDSFGEVTTRTDIHPAATVPLPTLTIRHKRDSASDKIACVAETAVIIITKINYETLTITLK
jgi:hypothetical protein